MPVSINKMTFLFLSLLVAVCLSGCEDDESNPPPFRPRPTGGSHVQPSAEAREKAAKHGTGLVLSEDEDKANASIKLPKIAETDFIESLLRRDPFRPFVELMTRKQEVRQMVQREIKLEDYDVEELKLIGIITNIGDPRAMVITPRKEGIVLHKGDYVGRADFVDPGAGGEKIQINWKVARIHGSGKEEERGVYLVRDDPLTPQPDDVTRFMPLHSEK